MLYFIVCWDGSSPFFTTSKVALFLHSKWAQEHWISKHFYTDFTKAWIGFSNSYFYLLWGNVFTWRNIARILPPAELLMRLRCQNAQEGSGRLQVCCVKLQVRRPWCSLQWREWRQLWHRNERWLLNGEKVRLSSCSCVQYPVPAGVLVPSVEGFVSCALGAASWWILQTLPFRPWPSLFVLVPWQP